MNTRRLASAAIILLGMPCLNAQNPTPKPQPNPALEVIRKSQGSTPGKSAKPIPAPDTPGTAAPNTRTEALLDPVSGKPADSPATVADPSPPPTTDPAIESDQPASGKSPPTPADSPATPRQGLAVRVEKLQTGKDELDPAQVKLVFPFPAKPLSPTPAGWCLKSSSSAPPFAREIELSPGNKITLTIRPDILVPEVDGFSVFSVPEPGFDPALAYRQTATVGTILSRSIRQLDHDSIELGIAIDKLQQILVSLPKPEPKAVPVPEPQPDPKQDPKIKPTPDRKR